VSTISNPRDLELAQLSELLWVERMLAFEAMPKMIAQVRNEELRAALEEHLEQTRYHAARVEQAMRDMDAEPLSSRSAALASLLEGHEAHDVKEPGLRDLHHARGAIRVEHLELGLYESLGLLPENKKEEEEALHRLESLARALST
jgi:ferritin-like metal-binding protein YciE